MKQEDQSGRRRRPLFIYPKITYNKAMDLTNLLTIKKILRENNLWPKKGYGQNFLVAAQPLISLIKAADIAAADTIIEIGPGLGTLTQELAKQAGLVLAIESDYKIVEWLRKYFKNTKNVKIIHADILKFSIFNFQFSNNFQFSISKPNNQLTSQPVNHYKVVSNLPYNITSPVIRKFLEGGNMIARQSQKDVHSTGATNGLPVALATHFLRHDSQSNDERYALSPKLELMVLMVQKEVAERLTAKPGSSDRGILTVMVELSGGAEIVEIVDRKCFYPLPDVDSAIIKISVDQPKISVDQHLFMKFVKIGFSQKRRQIHHPLSANFYLPNQKIKDILKSVEIDPTMRAEDLSLEQWIDLYNIIKLKLKIGILNLGD